MLKFDIELQQPRNAKQYQPKNKISINMGNSVDPCLPFVYQKWFSRPQISGKTEPETDGK